MSVSFAQYRSALILSDIAKRNESCGIESDGATCGQTTSDSEAPTPSLVFLAIVP